MLVDISIFGCLYRCRQVYFACVCFLQTCIFPMCLLLQRCPLTVFYCLHYLRVCWFQICPFFVHLLLADMSIFCVLYATRHVRFPSLRCLQTPQFSMFRLLAGMFISRVSTPCRVPAARLYLAKMNCARQIIVCIEIRIALFKCKRLYQFKNVCLVHLSLACLI